MEENKSFRILVVDDNRAAADIQAQLLRLWGYEVQVAYNGHEALALADDFKPDCVLSDINMPGLDGYRVVERLRNHEHLKNAIVIAVSASYEADRATKAGFDDGLLKPAPAAMLQQMLQRYLRMDKQLEKAAELIEKQGEVVGEARDLIKQVQSHVDDVKTEVKEVKQELKEVKAEVKEIKEKLKDESSDR